MPADAERAEAELLRGNAAFREGNRAAAIAFYRAALALRPDYARAHFNLGVALQEAGEWRQAAQHYELAARYDAGDPKPLVNWANLSKDRGDLETASQLYRRAMLVDSNDPVALNNLVSLALLAVERGDYASGWEDHELRFRTQPPRATLAFDSPLPMASPADLVRGARIAVRKEQGVGDQILFCTLLPELLARGVDATVEIDERLVPAFRRSLPALRFVSSDAAPAAFAACDLQYAMGSLPRAFRLDAASFSRQPSALLVADDARVAATRAQLPPGRRAIGIAWRSFQGPGREHVGARKSAALDCFAAFGPGVHLVDLQYGDVEAERATFDARHPGRRGSIPGLDLYNDLDGVLAAIAACDRVVTTSNVTAHFAGALGKPTWLVYLGANPPFHYWAPGPAGRSLWYPSVEIVNDPAWTSWEEAFASLSTRRPS